MSWDQNTTQTDCGLLPWHILLLFYILGILALRYPLPASFLSGLLFVVQQRFNKVKIPFILGMLGLLLGYGVANMQFPEKSVQVFEWMSERKSVEISAEVDEVEPKPEDRIQVILSDVYFFSEQGEKESLPGKVVWKWKNPQFWPSPGQEVSGEFRLEPVRGFQNPGTWDNKFYWKKKGVFYRTYTQGNETRIGVKGEKSFFWSLRLKLREQIIEHTPQGQSQGLLLALTMGDRSKLAYSTLDRIRRASLAHSLALSGLHLGFLITLAWGLAWALGFIHPGIYLKFPRPQLAIFIAIPMVLAYIWLGQAKPSLLRAGLMFFFWGLLLINGRKNVLLDGLFFALLCILLLRPLDIFDISLQLSCCAVAGIILLLPLFYPWIKKILPEKGLSRWVLFTAGSIFLVSLIANIVLLPLIVWNFGRVSLDIYTNLFWIPLIGWIVLPLGLLGILFSLLPGGELFSGTFLLAAETVLANMLQLLQFLDENGLLNFVLALRPIWPEIVGFWILLATGALFWKKIVRMPWGLLLCAFVLISYPSVKREISALRAQAGLQVIDVGQGQSVCMDFPRGKRILVDGGGSWNKGFDLGKFALAPALTYNRAPRLEKVVLTHSDFDHLRGLFYILQNFAVKEFVYNGDWPQGWDKRQLQSALQESAAKRKVVSSGREIVLGQGVELQVLHPERVSDLKQDNNRSLVLRLTHKGRGLALLPGDLEEVGISRLLSRDLSLQAEVLLVPHHGSKKSLSQRLYSRVEPEIGIVSCGYLNYFRLPHKEVLKALKSREIPVYLTSRQGGVRVVWDLDSNKRRIITKGF